MIWALVQQIVMDVPWGDNPASGELPVAIFIVFGVLFPPFLLSANLSVIVERDRVRARFFTFHLRCRIMGRDEILSHEVVAYSALRDLGGAGIRYGRQGRAYLVSGGQGAQLTFSNGDRLLLGSQRADDLDAALPSMSSRMRSLGQG